MDVQPSTRLTAAALQARLTSQTTPLLTRLENILATLLPSAPASADPSDLTSPSSSNNPQSSHVQTATESLQLSVETTAMIRACEELMGLSRAMKEIWLSGSLDTLDEDRLHDKQGNGDAIGRGKEINDADENMQSQRAREEKKLAEDRKFAVLGLLRTLTGKRDLQLEMAADVKPTETDEVEATARATASGGDEGSAMDLDMDTNQRQPGDQIGGETTAEVG